jgi:histidinol phosphatase-like enzyme
VSDYACDCHCRKPMPGMLLQAARDHGIDLRSSWMVGDILHDVEAGNRAGCRTVLIDNGNETEWRLGPRRIPTRMAPDLYAAAMLIASHGDAA